MAEKNILLILEGVFEAFFINSSMKLLKIVCIRFIEFVLDRIFNNSKDRNDSEILMDLMSTRKREAVYIYQANSVNEYTG